MWKVIMCLKQHFFLSHFECLFSAYKEINNKVDSVEIRRIVIAHLLS